METMDREQINDKLARKIAGESIVLLKNEGLLPLEEGTKIALLGNGAAHTIKGGTGSGDVNNRHSVSIYEGMMAAGADIVSGDWLKDYDSLYEQARLDWKDLVLRACENYENGFDAYAENPFSFPEARPVEESDIAGASVAIYVVSRISGEGHDRRLEKGDYYLSDRERGDLHFICQRVPVILLINAGGPVELTELLDQEPGVRAVLNISQLGQAGGHAVADILYGYKTPSGKLTNTWDQSYSDVPGGDSFGYLNGNLESDTYEEQFLQEYRPGLFPFGYGLSYTSFNIKAESVNYDKAEGRCSVEASVLNTGAEQAGKEVVQVYAALAPAEYPREQRRLVGFAKTRLLCPSQCQKLVISFGLRQLGSFNEAAGCWEVPAGTYEIYVGADSQNTSYAGAVEIKDTIKLEYDSQPEEEEYTGLSVDELVPLFAGNITEGGSHLGCNGIRTPGSAGETTMALEDAGFKSRIMADGPAGLRLRQTYEVDGATGLVYGQEVLGALENGFLAPMELHEGGILHHQYCTAFPVGTAMAQTWNTELLEAFGHAVATEMQEFRINLWLAPAMNIQRNPLCGRNFEYFSQDPLLTGKCAAAITRGVQALPECGVTIKHFACNNQEDNRMGVNVLVSERALREIYLRGFEIAVTEAQPAAVMSSYNLINGVHSANNYHLCTEILRKEWGFKGIVMTDWNATIESGGSDPAKCLPSGNDIIMPGNPDDLAAIRAAIAAGTITERTLRISAARCLRT